jgi:ribosomal protein L29
LVLAAKIKAHELKGKSKQELLSQVRVTKQLLWAWAAQRHSRTFLTTCCYCCTAFGCSTLLQLNELKTELAALRVAKVTGGAPNKLSKM